MTRHAHVAGDRDGRTVCVGQPHPATAEERGCGMDLATSA